LKDKEIIKVMPQKHQNAKIHKEYDPLPKELDIIGKKIVDAAYTVHKKLGPGLLKSILSMLLS